MTLRALRFDFPDLRLVLALAEAGSLGKAAQQLPLALSAASNRLRLLEERLGTRLFERGALGVAPTPAGRIFLEHARRLLRLADEAQQAVDALAHAGRITLRIQANTTGSGSELPGLLGRFLADWPQVDLQLTESSSREAMEAVLKGRAELAVIDSHYGHAELDILPFRRDRLVLLVPAGHRYAGRDQLAFAELSGEALVLPPAGSSLRQFLERMALLEHRRLTVRAEAQGFEALAQLVAAGVGLAIVPEHAARVSAASPGLRRLPLQDAWAARELCLASRPVEELAVPVRRLLAFLSASGATA